MKCQILYGAPSEIQTHDLVVKVKQISLVNHYPTPRCLVNVQQALMNANGYNFSL